MNKGILKFISSKNPPVFEEKEFHINFDRPPVIGEPFCFYKNEFDSCNLSMVKAINVSGRTYTLTTRNSVYELEL
jgi:hypothetical protein